MGPGLRVLANLGQETRPRLLGIRDRHAWPVDVQKDAIRHENKHFSRSYEFFVYGLLAYAKREEQVDS